MPRLDRRFGVVAIRLAERAVEVVFVVAIAFTTNVVTAMVFYLLLDAASQQTILVGIAYRQRVTPNHLQGVNVVGRMIAWGGQPFGAVLGGIVASTVSVRAALALSSLAVGATLILGLVGPLRLTPSGLLSGAPQPASSDG